MRLVPTRVQRLVLLLAKLLHSTGAMLTPRRVPEEQRTER